MPLKLSPTQIAFNARGDGKFNKPFKEQVDFFRQKLNLPSEHYDDILKSAHDKAFMVAGVAKADLLDDFRAEIDKAVAGDITFARWKKEFQRVVQKHGWEGWTGSDTQAGRDWRARVIYQTNLATSYAAGRYEQMDHPDVVARRPYLKYLHNDNVLSPRPLHKDWSGLVLPRDDIWWEAHRPPNGYGCQCRVVPVTAAEYQGDTAPDDGTWVKKDRYGVVHEIPNGVDYGFDYTPGEHVDAALRQMVQDKLIRYPAAITRALSRDVNRYLIAHEDVAGFAQRALEHSGAHETLWLGFVDPAAVVAIKTAIDVDTTGYLVLLPSDGIDHADKHHQYDGGGQRPARPDDYRIISRLLAEGVITPGKDAATGAKRIVTQLKIGDEKYRAVFEARTGSRNRAMVLVSLVIMTGR